jgi:hypothetical protein
MKNTCAALLILCSQPLWANNNIDSGLMLLVENPDQRFVIAQQDSAGVSPVVVDNSEQDSATQIVEAGDNIAEDNIAEAMTMRIGSNSSPWQVTLFDRNPQEDQERLWSQTKLVFGLAVGVAVTISLLPEDVSNWASTDEGMGEKWWNNVSSGPTWDDDDVFLNYVGHPYFGGVYYVTARSSGYNQWNSFVYSFLMSTFYWEYGIESFAEVPSIQDLIVTPVGGWIYGEWAYQQKLGLEQEKMANGELSGWQTTGLFFLDPVDAIAKGINNVAGGQLIKSGTATIMTQPAFYQPIRGEELQDYVGFAINLEM